MRYLATLIVFVMSAGLLGSCELLAKGQLEGAVKKALKDDPRTAQYEFEVSQQADGSIVITGEVLQPADIDAVTAVAEAVPGVGQILNRCAVPEPGSDMIQDTVAPMF
jgi:hypothetical protein